MPSPIGFQRYGRTATETASIITVVVGKRSQKAAKCDLSHTSP